LPARIRPTSRRFPSINAAKSTGPASVRTPGERMVGRDVPRLGGGHLSNATVIAKSYRL
jgi:hypothetical protein